MGEILAFTGIEYSGRTTLVLNIAHQLASEEYKVLVVDADQTRGKVAASLNLKPIEGGLVEAVTGLVEQDFNSHFINDKKSGISILTLPISAKANDLFHLSALQAKNFYEKVRSEFDYVLVDCGNILYEALSSVSLFEADNIIVVLPAEKRGAIWMESMKDILCQLDETRINYVTTQLSEIPELKEDQMLPRKRAFPIPYIFNMRDYTATGDIFMANPTGKKSRDFVKSINAIVSFIKEIS